jgi:retron-type reverse transcriptase
VMEGGLVRPVDEGTPQGGPLSPILSNLVLDDLDKELVSMSVETGPRIFTQKGPPCCGWQER